MSRLPARQPGKATLTRYGSAIVMIAVALAIREIIGPPEIGLQFVTFFPAVALTAVYGGFWAGMLATAISAVLATFLYIPPYGQFSFDFHRATLISNLVFVLDEIMVCGAIQAMHNHYLKLRAANERLDENRNLLHAIIEGTSDPIFLKDTAGRFIHCNGAQLRLIGKPADEIVGLDASSVFPAAQARHLAEHDAEVIAAGRPLTFEDHLTVHSGEERDFLTIKGPFFDEQGHLKGVFGIARDITERKAVEKQLRAAKAEAECANNAKSRFLAAASHDLRQPLSALSIYVGLLGDKLAPGDGPLVDNMKNCVSSLTELLSDLLDLSKLEAGVVKANVRDIAVGDLLTKLISAHAPRAQLQGLQLRYRSSGVAAHTDPVLFERILANFVSNAIRYSERGGVLVACRRRRGRTWVEVWDTGIGIPADKIVEIFDEFKQLGDQARSRGSGLGLAIAAKTAALLGLEIRVASRQGRGSVFAVELPVAAAAPPAPAKLKPDAAGAARIALVDDNHAVLTALEYALQNAGHQVVAAANTEELLDGLDGRAPDVVVADYRLARGETGFDAIRAVRRKFGDELPAIVVTGDTNPGLLRAMADQGILVQHKPLAFDALNACIAESTRA